MFRTRWSQRVQIRKMRKDKQFTKMSRVELSDWGSIPQWVSEKLCGFITKLPHQRNCSNRGFFNWTFSFTESIPCPVERISSSTLVLKLAPQPTVGLWCGDLPIVKSTVTSFLRLFDLQSHCGRIHPQLTFLPVPWASTIGSGLLRSWTGTSRLETHTLTYFD